MSRNPVPILVAALLGGCSAETMRGYIYRPDAIVPTGIAAWSGVAPRAVTATTEDGMALNGFYWPPTNGRSDVLVYFHGNGGNARAAAERAGALTAGGHGVLVADYRGYGGNAGTPTEPGLIRDAEAWMRLAEKLQPTGARYVFGHSLGAAVALRMAAEFPVDGVVTLGGFNRLSDVAPGIARPFLPDRYDSSAAIHHITAPIVLMHGTADRTISYDNVERLHAASGGRARILTLPGADHQVDLAQVAPAMWAALGVR